MFVYAVTETGTFMHPVFASCQLPNANCQSLFSHNIRLLIEATRHTCCLC